MPTKYYLIFIVLFVLSCAQKREMSICEFDQLYKYIEQNKKPLTLENVTVYERENEDQYEYYCNEYKVGYWFSIKSIWGYDLKLYEDGEKWSDGVLKNKFPKEFQSIKSDILRKINITAEIFYNYDIRVIQAVNNHYGLRTIYFSSRDNKTLIISEDSTTINNYAENKSVLIKKYSDLCILINQ
ncbi:MAG: hypothetical protein MUF28_11135 [Ignavibacterium sp.]|jgi:hypothetical protein|nr:hypothetical protein [Ignavibacterium sp.]